MSQRNMLYDIAKGLGILLVIWGHTTTPFFHEIYAFHMPFFFIVSGVFYKSRPTFKEQLMRNTSRLIYPFLLFSVLIYVFYLVWDLLFHTGFSYASILNIIPYQSVMTTPLWFLVTLFWVSTLYFFFSKINKRWILFSVLLILFLTGSLVHIPQFFYIPTAMGYFIYYFIGNNFVKGYETRFLEKRKMGYKSMLFAISFFAFVFFFQLKSMSEYKVLTILLAFLTALVGSSMLLNLSSLCVNAGVLTKTLAYIGRNSLPIFALQLPLMELTRPLSGFLFERDTYLWGGMNVIINLALSIVVAEILYRLFPKILNR